MMQPFEWIDVKCDLPNYDEIDYLRLFEKTPYEREREQSDIVFAADEIGNFYVGYFSKHTGQLHDDFQKGTAWWTFHPLNVSETFDGVPDFDRYFEKHGEFPDPRLIFEPTTLVGLHIKCWAYIPSIPDRLSWQSHFRV